MTPIGAPTLSRRPLARDAAVLVLAAAALALLLRLAHPAELGWEGAPLAADELTFAQAQTLAKSQPVLWVDARPAAQFAAAHFPGAVHLAQENWDAGFAALMERWTPDCAVIVYCDSAACSASREVAARLREHGGLPQVHTLHGGWESMPADLRDASRPGP